MNVWFYIILLIFILLIILFLYWYTTQNENKPLTPRTPGSYNKHNTPESSVKYGGNTGQTPIFMDYSQNNNKVLSKARGRLFQFCPCAEGFSCRKGLCRRNIGQDCLMNRECSSGYCIMGKCVEKPPQLQPIENAVCLFGQIMGLNDNNFQLVNDWMSITNVISITRMLNNPENYYIITSDGVLKVLSYTHEMQKINNDIDPKQLFYYDNELYLIGKDGFLYIIKNEHSPTWDTELLLEFKGQDLKDVEIENVFTSYYPGGKNISLLLTYIHNQTKLISYIDDDNMWIRQECLAIYYIDKWENRVEVHVDRVLFYYKNKVIDKLNLQQSYNSIVYTKYGLYLTDDYKVYYYKPNSDRTLPVSISDFTQHSSTDTITKSTDLNKPIRKLINTESQVWLILDNICFKRH